jgi:hypothetical protein
VEILKVLCLRVKDVAKTPLFACVPAPQSLECLLRPQRCNSIPNESISRGNNRTQHHAGCPVSRDFFGLFCHRASVVWEATLEVSDDTRGGF